MVTVKYREACAKRIVRKLESNAADQKHQDLIRDVFGRNRCEWRGDDTPDDEGFSYWRFPAARTNFSQAS